MLHAVSSEVFDLFDHCKLYTLMMINSICTLCRSIVISINILLLFGVKNGSSTFRFGFIYFSQRFSKKLIANPFILKVKAGRKLQREKIQLQIRLYWSQFRVLIYHKHVNTLDEPTCNY